MWSHVFPIREKLPKTQSAISHKTKGRDASRLPGDRACEAPQRPRHLIPYQSNVSLSPRGRLGGTRMLITGPPAMGREVIPETTINHIEAGRRTGSRASAPQIQEFLRRGTILHSLKKRPVDARPAHSSLFFSPAFLTFAHLANAAFRALALRCSVVSRAALFLPPLEPPIFPSATA